MSDDPIYAIFEREINRIDSISRERALDEDELSRLDILVRSVKNYTKRDEKKPDNLLSDLTTEDILILLNRGKTNEAKGRPQSKGEGTNRKKGRKRGAVAKGADKGLPP
jgi:hypothetical protein